MPSGKHTLTLLPSKPGPNGGPIDVYQCGDCGRNFEHNVKAFKPFDEWVKVIGECPGTPKQRVTKGSLTVPKSKQQPIKRAIEEASPEGSPNKAVERPAKKAKPAVSGETNAVSCDDEDEDADEDKPTSTEEKKKDTPPPAENHGSACACSKWTAEKGCSHLKPLSSSNKAKKCSTCAKPLGRRCIHVHMVGTFCSPKCAKKCEDCGKVHPSTRSRGRTGYVCQKCNDAAYESSDEEEEVSQGSQFLSECFQQNEHIEKDGSMVNRSKVTSFAIAEQLLEEFCSDDGLEWTCQPVKVLPSVVETKNENPELTAASSSVKKLEDTGSKSAGTQEEVIEIIYHPACDERTVRSIMAVKDLPDGGLDTLIIQAMKGSLSQNYREALIHDPSRAAARANNRVDEWWAPKPNQRVVGIAELWP